MTKTQVEIGGSLRGMLSEVAEAWKAAERGEVFTPLNKVVFLNEAVFASIVTPRRRELLSHLRSDTGRRRAGPSTGSRPRSSTVHGDVKALEAAGLLTVHEDGRLTTDVDEVALTFRVGAAA